MYDDVGRVWAALVISGTEQSSAEISGEIGISPDYAHSIGDLIFNPRGNAVGKRIGNYWSFSSSPLVDSKDLDEHLRALLTVLLPFAERITNIQRRNNVFIFCKWESSGMLFGSGPIISPSACRDIGLLGVELHFDIFCSLEHDLSKDAAPNQ